MRKWYPLLVVLLACLASALAYDRLPERVPTHWNEAGEIDGYGSRLSAVLLLPGTIALLALLAPVLPRIDPRRDNYEKFRSTYDLVMNAVLTFMLGLHVLLLAAGLGVAVPVARVAPAGVGLLFALLGNVLPRTRSNWLFGIRTPWTLSSERVWQRTHRVGGFLMFGAGLVIIVAALAAPPRVTALVLVASVAVALLGSVGYSYAAWRQERGS